jgi:hypothetical protein
MAFEYWGYTFEGAWLEPTKLESRSGIYVIWCKQGDTWTVLAVGESSDVKNSVLTHAEKDQWKRLCAGTVHFSATYTPTLPPAGRHELAELIHSKANPQSNTIGQ